MKAPEESKQSLSRQGSKRTAVNLSRPGSPSGPSPNKRGGHGSSRPASCSQPKRRPSLTGGSKESVERRRSSTEQEGEKGRTGSKAPHRRGSSKEAHELKALKEHTNLMPGTFHTTPDAGHRISEHAAIRRVFNNDVRLLYARDKAKGLPTSPLAQFQLAARSVRKCVMMVMLKARMITAFQDEKRKIAKEGFLWTFNQDFEWEVCQEELPAWQRVHFMMSRLNGSLALRYLHQKNDLRVGAVLHDFADDDAILRSEDIRKMEPIEMELLDLEDSQRIGQTLYQYDVDIGKHDGENQPEDYMREMPQVIYPFTISWLGYGNAQDATRGMSKEAALPADLQSASQRMLTLAKESLAKESTARSSVSSASPSKTQGDSPRKSLQLDAPSSPLSPKSVTSERCHQCLVLGTKTMKERKYWINAIKVAVGLEDQKAAGDEEDVASSEDSGSGFSDIDSDDDYEEYHIDVVDGFDITHWQAEVCDVDIDDTYRVKLSAMADDLGFSFHELEAHLAEALASLEELSSSMAKACRGASSASRLVEALLDSIRKAGAANPDSLSAGSQLDTKLHGLMASLLQSEETGGKPQLGLFGTKLMALLKVSSVRKNLPVTSFPPSPSVLEDSVEEEMQMASEADSTVVCATLDINDCWNYESASSMPFTSGEMLNAEAEEQVAEGMKLSPSQKETVSHMRKALQEALQECPEEAPTEEVPEAMPDYSSHYEITAGLDLADNLNEVLPGLFAVVPEEAVPAFRVPLVLGMLGGLEAAATKLQALQRGRTGRAELGRHRAATKAAATKLQAIQRGRAGRAEVEKLRAEKQAILEGPGEEGSESRGSDERKESKDVVEEWKSRKVMQKKQTRILLQPAHDEPGRFASPNGSVAPTEDVRAAEVKIVIPGDSEFAILGQGEDIVVIPGEDEDAPREQAPRHNTAKTNTEESPQNVDESGQENTSASEKRRGTAFDFQALGQLKEEDEKALSDSEGSQSSDDLSYEAFEIFGDRLDSAASTEPPAGSRLNTASSVVPERVAEDGRSSAASIPLPSRPPAQPWSQAFQMTPGEHSWHRAHGRTGLAASHRNEHDETLSRVMNPVIPGNPEPPPTPEWPLLANAGPSRGKRLWVNRLYDSVSTQQRRLGQSRLKGEDRVSIESVCLAKQLRSGPRERAAPERTWQQQGLWQAADLSPTHRVHLPSLQHAPQQGDLQKATVQAFHEALASPGYAPTSGTPARRKFLQAPGWQPWKTHKSSAFDNKK